MLISFSELLGRSWRYTTREYRHFLPFVAWLILPNVVLALFGYLAMWVGVSTSSMALNFITAIILLMLVVLNALLSVWISLSLTYCVGRGVTSGITPDWRESFHATVPFYWSGVWVSILTTLVVIGGTVIFLIPGIIFMGWYLFSIYEVIFSHERGTGALAASKSLVVGRWWSVVSRFLVVALVYTSISIGIQAVANMLVPLQSTFFSQQLVGNGIRSVATSLIAPFIVAAMVTLYVNVKQTPKTVQAPNLKS